MKLQTKQNAGDRKADQWLRGARQHERGLSQRPKEGIWGSHGNVLHCDCDSGYMTLCVRARVCVTDKESVHLELVNLIVFKLYCNKADQK